MNIKPASGLPAPEEKYIVTADQIAQMTGVRRDAAYNSLERAALHLSGRTISIPATDAKDRPVLGACLKFGWTTSVEYFKTRQVIHVVLNPLLLPHVSDLKKEFGSFQASEYIRLSHFPAMRIFELLSIPRQNRVLTMPIGQLRDILDADQKYSATQDFKRFVLDPAIKKINALTPFQVQMTMLKVGKRVHSVEFAYTRMKGKKLPRLEGESDEQYYVRTHQDHLNLA